MKTTFSRQFVLSILIVVSLSLLLSSGLWAAPCDPAAADYAGHKGKTIYVSKLGDSTDGSSWQKAFRTIQAALLAVPDDQGGHRIIVRPDTYVEANLYPARKGAEGAYNLLIGDVDGSLGSGATGRIIMDGSCPGMAVRPDEKTDLYKIIKSDLPESGFKSVNWWGSFLTGTTIKAQAADNTELTISCLTWDRWILRNLYTTGCDAGFFWDIGMPSGDGFTVIVEDCVGIGRAFGGGVCYPKVRPNEPNVFRRCYFLALDWVGDTAAVLIGGSEKSMPEHPHLILEDCTMVHADNALATSYASHCARAKLIGCRLIVLNFTQPEMGGKSTGIICTENHSPTGHLHVDIEDCILAGYSVFTPGADAKAVTYTTKGKVQAYVQYRQSVPKGFERLGLWPVELYDRMAPPQLRLGGEHFDCPIEISLGRRRGS